MAGRGEAVPEAADDGRGTRRQPPCAGRLTALALLVAALAASPGRSALVARPVLGALCRRCVGRAPGAALAHRVPAAGCRRCPRRRRGVGAARPPRSPSRSSRRLLAWLLTAYLALGVGPDLASAAGRLRLDHRPRTRRQRDPRAFWSVSNRCSVWASSRSARRSRWALSARHASIALLARCLAAAIDAGSLGRQRRARGNQLGWSWGPRSRSRRVPAAAPPGTTAQPAAEPPRGGPRP